MGSSSVSAATMATSATAAETSASGVAIGANSQTMCSAMPQSTETPISRSAAPLARTEPQSSATMGIAAPNNAAAPATAAQGPARSRYHFA